MKNLLPLLAILLLLGGCASVEIPEPGPASGEVPSARETLSPATAPAKLPFSPVTAPLDAELPFDPALRHGRLDNGLTWYKSEAKRS